MSKHWTNLLAALLYWSSSIVAMFFEVVFQLSVVVADRFTLESEDVSVLVEEEVVLLVFEPAKSDFHQGVGAVEIHASHVTIGHFVMLRLLDVMCCLDNLTCCPQLFFHTLLKLVQYDLLGVQSTVVDVLQSLFLHNHLHGKFNNHQSRVVIDHTVDHFANSKLL